MNPLALLALAGHWTPLFLGLAAVGALAAQMLRSRALLVIALVSGAVWMGSGGLLSAFFPLARANVQGTGWRFLAGAVLLAVMGIALRKLSSARFPAAPAIYEGFAVHLGGLGALLLCLPGYLDRPLPWPLLRVGCAVLFAVIACIAVLGRLRAQRGLLLAALIYAAIGLWRLQWLVFDTPATLATAGLLTAGAAWLCWRMAGSARIRARPENRA